MTEPSQYFKGRTVQEQMDEVIGYVDTRAAEVATTAIASDVAQVHQDMLDADADAQAAAASAAAAAGTLANAVKKTGEASQSIAGDIAVAGNLTGGTVTVPAPVNNTDAANKKYVDDQDANDVHLTGAQSVAGVKTFSDSPVVPTETTGTFSSKAATSNKVKNELDNYVLVVRTVNDQQIAGEKMFMNGLLGQSLSGGSSSSSTNRWYYIEYTGQTTQFVKFWVANYINNGASKIIEGAMFWNGSSSAATTYIKMFGTAYNVIDNNIKITIDSDNKFRTWFYVPAYHSIMINVEAARSWDNNITTNLGYVDNPDWNDYGTVKSVVVL